MIQNAVYFMRDGRRIRTPDKLLYFANFVNGQEEGASNLMLLYGLFLGGVTLPITNRGVPF